MSDSLRVKSLIEVTKSLSALVQSEIDLLRGHQPVGLGAIQDEKARLSARYASAIDEARRTESLAKVEPSLRDGLRAATKALADRVAQNLRLVTAAKSVNRTMVKAIHDAMVGERLAPPGYAPNGRLELAARGGSPFAITFDQRI